ncbi:efflux RND transporter periplasmic adaptor subunit [bacterium]|nr:MAG: efflux RND transporter periplasmic adaptor subunit [bacterium]
MNQKKAGSKIFFAIAAILAIVGGFYYNASNHSQEGEPKAVGEKYTCGMHPFIISDTPGNCPICGMALTKIESVPETVSSPATAKEAKKPEDDFFADLGGKPVKAEHKIIFYRNPMNPAITSKTPAKDEMGMDYIPVYADELAGGGGVEGYSPVKIPPQRMPIAGLRTARAKMESMGRSIRTVGVVEADETRIRRVQTKVGGWVEKLYVNFRGQEVKKGAPLFSLYSPELLAGQQEYLEAKKTAGKFASSSDESLRKMGDELLAAAKKRLELLDVPPEVVSELDKGGEPKRSITFYSPVSGFALAKEIFEGQKIEAGMELFTVADLSRVWVVADLYEMDAKEVRVGSTAFLSPSFDPARALSGKVSFLSPVLEPETRTLKARFEFPNPGNALKPGIFADVNLEVESGEGITVPDGAVMETGARKIVFVHKGGGEFEPREVVLGVVADGKAQILGGVAEGEEVVIDANFLLDSESRLRAALSRAAAPSPEAGHGEGK